MGKAKFYSASIRASVVFAIAYPAHEFHTNILFCFYLSLTCSAAVEAELSKKQIQLRGPEELQQATRFLHDNGNAYLRAYNFRWSTYIVYSNKRRVWDKRSISAGSE